MEGYLQAGNQDQEACQKQVEVDGRIEAYADLLDNGHHQKASELREVDWRTEYLAAGTGRVPTFDLADTF